MPGTVLGNRYTVMNRRTDHTELSLAVGGIQVKHSISNGAKCYGEDTGRKADGNTRSSRCYLRKESGRILGYV